MSFYTKGQFIDFCKNVFGPYVSRNAGLNIEVVCPICKDLKERQTGRDYTNRKLSIHTEEHVLHCWVCGYGSKSPLHLLKKYFPDHVQSYMDKFLDAEELRAQREKDFFNDDEQKEPVIARLPSDFTLLATADPRDSYIRWARNYLKGRGALSEDILWYWRLGVSKDDTEAQNRIIVPSFDSEGILNYYSARAMKKRMREKYKNPLVLRENIVFNELNIDWSSELILVEGVFDLIKCPENATALLGSELPSHFLLFEKIVENKTPVVLALDPEAQNKAYTIAKRLGEFDVPVKILKLRPEQEDVGALTKSEFNDLLQTAKLFSTEYLLRSKIRDII